MPQILRHFTNIFSFLKPRLFEGLSRAKEFDCIWWRVVYLLAIDCVGFVVVESQSRRVSFCLVSSRDAGAGARHFEWRDSISSRCRSLCCVWLPRHSPTSTSHEDLLRRSQLSIASPVYSGQTKISDRKLAVAFRDAGAGACSASKRRWLDRPCVTLRAAKRRFESFKARRKNKK